jgi:hypothetical protein
MIFIRFERRVVSTEALIPFVIIMINFPPRPTITLDAEMIIALNSQFTTTCTTFEQALCQRDRSWNTMALHLLDSNVLILVDILLINLIPSGLCMSPQRQNDSYTYEKFPHILEFLVQN